MKLRGKAHCFGANVDTDAIIPARYLNVSDPKELAKHAMEDIDSDFVRKVQPGDMIVATTNFGCGSSREHAPLALKAAGLSCVLARSFARIFFRNSINIGLPLCEIEEAGEIKSGDLLEVDLSAGRVENLTQERVYQARPYPPFMLQVIAAGGLVGYTKKRISK